MNNVTRNRWQVRVAAVIIFVLGFTAGILALNVYRGVVRGDGPGNRFDALSERQFGKPDRCVSTWRVVSFV